MAEPETSHAALPSVASQSFSHSSVETQFFFFPWEGFIVSLSPPPKLFDACKCIVVVFPSGVWYVAISGECEDYM